MLGVKAGSILLNKKAFVNKKVKRYMYVCVYICMCVYIYIYIYLYIS